MGMRRGHFRTVNGRRTWVADHEVAGHARTAAPSVALAEHVGDGGASSDPFADDEVVAAPGAGEIAREAARATRPEGTRHVARDGDLPGGTHDPFPDLEPMRVWQTSDQAATFTVTLYDTGRTDQHGRSHVAYAVAVDGDVAFSGDDYRPAPSHAVDGDDAVAGLLGFVSYGPVDGDDDGWTDRQLAFVAEYGDSLSMHAHDLEADYDDENADERPLNDWGRLTDEVAYADRMGRDIDDVTAHRIADQLSKDEHATYPNLYRLAWSGSCDPDAVERELDAHFADMKAGFGDFADADRPVYDKVAAYARTAGRRGPVRGWDEMR